ncbi:MAG: hypothetical protein U0174_02245 [Polyangiaceae bacterium]
MSKDKPDAHDAVAELKKGLGHLFNAAKSAVNELPTKDLEDAVLTGVKEVGRALGNVKDTLETELLGKTERASSAPHAGEAAAPSASPSTPPAAQASPQPSAPASPEAPVATPPAEPKAAPPAEEPDTGGGI